MGRLSRYKKTKSCDPFYRGTRKDADDTENVNTKRCNKSVHLEDGVDEQKIPKSMKLLLERAKKFSSKKKKKLKRIDDETKQNKALIFKKKKDENKREYFDRIEREASLAVIESLKNQKKMSARRKSHLSKRKEKLKVKKNPERVLQRDMDFSDLRDDIKFGDVASQPPMLTAKPRKVPHQDKGKMPLLLNSKLTPEKPNKASGKNKEEKTKQSKTFVFKAKKRKHMSEAEKTVMDMERLRVIQWYRTSKKKGQQNLQQL